MGYSICELKPLNSVLVVDNEEIPLSLITFRIDVILSDKFGSVPGALSAINEDPINILKIIWPLVINKEKFSNSFAGFEKYCFESKESIVLWSKRMTNCLYEIIKKSMPLIKNHKRHKEIQEINSTQSEDFGVPCYATYFDTVAHRYGYSIDQFYDLTLRQLHILLKTIGDKQYEELEIQAALAGRKLKPKIKFNDISLKEEEDHEKQALDALEKLQQRYKDNKNG